MAAQRISLLVISILFSALAFADSKSSSSSSSSSNPNKFAMFEVGGGTSFLSQYIANDNIEHPLGVHVAARYHASIFHAGVSYLGIWHHDSIDVNPPGMAPNQKEVDTTESFTLTSLNAGFVFGNWMILDAGYGIASFSRSQVSPFATTTASSVYNGTGTGWMAGGSIIPIHIGPMSIGASGYYFDAKSGDYSSDVVSGTTETIKASGNGSTHSFGWFAGLSLFYGL